MMLQGVHSKQTASRTTATIALFLLFSMGAKGGFADSGTLPLEIIPASADVGKILIGSNAELEFIISNTGSEDIRLVYI